MLNAWIVSGVQDLVATKDIKIDEEVTICYLPSAEAGKGTKMVLEIII